jgi:adenine-specific DNA-methyltransferase
MDSTLLKDWAGSDLQEYSAHLQKRFHRDVSSAKRKTKGQVFTPPEIARFMANLFVLSKHLRILDPGAGTGSLSAAFCERIAGLPSPRSIEIHLFENDPAALSLLEKNMGHCREILDNAGHRFSYTIHGDDFLLAGSSQQESLFDENDDLGQFDAVIMNPPYFKLAGNSRYAKRIAHVVHGQPNIYALFLAQAARLLRPGGELVAITPRSFCNGLYFREFRRWFFERMSLDHIHLFESRTDPFQEADILQESVITRWHRLGNASTTIGVGHSFGRDIPEQLEVQELPASKIVDDSCGDMVVRIPAKVEDAQILDLAESWANRFGELGLRISTGPVVLFRAKKYLLRDLNGEETTPLLSSHNVRPFQTVWPVYRKKKHSAFQICPESMRHLVPTRNYVLMRRFSAKEERRRLTASCILSVDHSRPYLALENHLNYVYHAHRELRVDECWGLAALFNSALLDRYFRTLSGNTQVNATEIRNMKFPDLSIISRIGKRIKKLEEFLTTKVEKIVVKALQVNPALERFLLESAL